MSNQAIQAYIHFLNELTPFKLDTKQAKTYLKGHYFVQRFRLRFHNEISHRTEIGMQQSLNIILEKAKSTAKNYRSSYLDQFIKNSLDLCFTKDEIEKLARDMSIPQNQQTRYSITQLLKMLLEESTQ